MIFPTAALFFGPDPCRYGRYYRSSSRDSALESLVALLFRNLAFFNLRDLIRPSLGQDLCAYQEVGDRAYVDRNFSLVTLIPSLAGDIHVQQYAMFYRILDLPMYFERLKKSHGPFWFETV